jgi:hypothetical protein
MTAQADVPAGMMRQLIIAMANVLKSDDHCDE